MSYTSYYEVAMAQSLFSFFLAVIVLIVIVAGISVIFRIRKSKQYRKEIMDMYVAAKTKKIAKDESIDIVEEYESFKKWLKKQRMIYSNYELDDVIEAELMEKVSESKQKKIAEVKPKK